MRQIRVTFLSGELKLEGVLAMPQGSGPFPTVIVCHPHPLYGGSMDNNVVCGLSRTLTQTSFVSFRFNFRGVGSSQGEFDRGVGEQKDVEAAICFTSTVKEVDSRRIGLAGYSAGAGFGLPVAIRDDRIAALAGVSPPLSTFDFSSLTTCLKPKLLISGSSDNFTDIGQFLEFCLSLAEPKEYESVEGADHFWRGYESRLAAKVTAFFTRVL